MSQSESTPRPDIDLHSLRIVHAIAETGSITGAARALGFSQPAISQHLQRAESRLGMPLIVRTGRTVRLSDAGLVLSRHATAIETILETVSDELSSLACLRAGRVRIVAFPSASSTIIPRLLATLRRSAPGVSINYFEAEPPEAIAMLKDGQCDLALTFSYSNDAEDPHEDAGSGIGIATLFIDQLFLLLPAAHPLASEQVVDLVALKDDPWIAGCFQCRRHLLDACHGAGFQPSISYETDNTVAVVGMVASGLGVALLPRLALGTAALPVGAVVRRTDPGTYRSLHLLSNTDAMRTPALSAALSAVAGLDGSVWKLARPSVGPTADRPPREQDR